MIIRMSKPLTRTEDDVDRENLLKDQVSHLKGESFKGIFSLMKTSMFQLWNLLEVTPFFTNIQLISQSVCVHGWL
jgi:hypothetical protein